MSLIILFNILLTTDFVMERYLTGIDEYVLWCFWEGSVWGHQADNFLFYIIHSKNSM